MVDSSCVDSSLLIPAATSRSRYSSRVGDTNAYRCISINMYIYTYMLLSLSIIIIIIIVINKIIISYILYHYVDFTFALNTYTPRTCV